MNLSILLLTTEPLLNNRAIINNLWCRILPEKNVKLFWVTKTNSQIKQPVKKFGNLFIFSYSNSSQNSILNYLFSIIYKFRIANYFARNRMINHLQVRNGITDGLISLILFLFYSIPYSFHLSSLHGFEDKALLSGRTGLQSIKFKLRIFFYPFLYKLFFNYASLVQPISEYMGDYLVDYVNVDKRKIFPIPISATKNEIELYDIKQISKNPTIVYAGSLDISRDIDFLIRVFALIHKRNPKTNFKILGIVEKATDIDVLVNDISLAGIKKVTNLLLNVNPREVVKHLSECDIGISPIKPNSRYIVSTPTKTIEYLSCGLPVVCNKEILDQEFIIRKSNGGIAVNYNEKEFVDAIISITNDRRLYSRMSRNGQDWILNNRTYDDLAEDLVHKYSTISSNLMI